MVQESPSSCPLPISFPALSLLGSLAHLGPPPPLSWEKAVQVCLDLLTTCDSSSSRRCSPATSSPRPSHLQAAQRRTPCHARLHLLILQLLQVAHESLGGTREGSAAPGTAAPAYLVLGLPSTYPLAEAGVFCQAAELG